MEATCTTVLLVRHGDRYDYDVGKEVWKARCKKHGMEPSDPPLSALGHAQARDAAAYLANQAIDEIISSPYLRALQTAQPLAHLTGLPLCVDFALAESAQKPGNVPPALSRLPYLPEISDAYTPLLGSLIVDGADGPQPGAEPRQEHMRRMLLLARELGSERFRGKTVALFSHAASVLLVGALRGCTSLPEAGKLAPCGIWKLTSTDGRTWEIVQKGDDNTAYVQANSGATPPWGFENSSRPLSELEPLWAAARELGPRELSEFEAAPAELQHCDDQEYNGFES